MRIKAIERCDDPAVHLLFGNRMTVLADLTTQQRHEVCAAIEAAFSGKAVALGMQCESNEQTFWLTPEEFANRQWAISPPLLFASDELPGITNYSFADGHNNEDSDALMYRQALEREREQIADEIAAIGKALDDNENQLLSDANLSGYIEKVIFSIDNRMTRLEQQQAEEQDFDPNNTNLDSFETELARYEALESAISTRITELRTRLGESGEFANTIRVLLEEARNDEEGPIRRDEVKRIDEFGQRYQTLAEENNRLCARPSAPKWIIAQTLGEYEEAKGRYEALQYQFKQGAKVHAALERAKERFETAEAAWNELDHGTHDELEALQTRSNAFCVEVGEYLGEDVSIAQVGEALATRREKLCAQDDPRIGLCQAFASIKIVVHYDNVCDVAETWLQSQDIEEISVEDAQAELANALVDLRDQQTAKEDLIARHNDALGLELNDDVLRAAFGPQVVRDDEYLRAEKDLQIAELRMLRKEIGKTGTCFVRQEQRDEYEEVASELHHRLVAAQRSLDTCVRRVSLFDHEAEVAQKDECSAWWFPDGDMADFRKLRITDVSSCTFEAISDALLRRISHLRISGSRDTFPLILNATFDGMDERLARRLLSMLAKVSNLVQVIYFAQTNVATQWASSQSSDVVQCESAQTPTAASC